MLQQTADAPQANRATSAVALQIHPMSEFVTKGEDVSPAASQTTLVEPVLHETSTLSPPMLYAALDEPKMIANPEEPHIPEPPSTTQEQSTSPPSVEPQMGDARIVDGQKQVYFFGFGWIEDNDTSNECVYAEDMYENGNKVGSMGGGIFVDGDGDINKMVGTMDASETG